MAFKPNSETSFPVRTHSRLGYAANRDQKYEAIDTNTRPIWWKPQMQPPLYQLEGPGWENDNVGFRIYFDARNGVDIFGKTTKRMVFDEIGIDSDYHKLQPWGMDVLKVGNSLGAGSLAFSKNGVLYRAGERGGAYFRKGANGKEYSALSVIYQNDTCGGVVLDYSQTFSINAGKHYYKNDVCLKNYQDIDSVAIGIVTLKLTDESMVVKTKKGGRVLLTHGKQSENDDLLGMALYFPPSSPSSLEIIGKRETGIGSTALLITKAEEQMHYYFFGMWEKADARFATKTGCLNYVLSEVNKLENPLKVNGL